MLNREQVRSIFENSHVNGARYDGDNLEPMKWKWPTGTWLRKRMQEVEFYDNVIYLNDVVDRESV